MRAAGVLLLVQACSRRCLSLYSRQAVRQPSLDELRHFSERFGFAASNSELESYQQLIAELSASMTPLDRVENRRIPGLSVPRNCGYRPSASDNSGNAWYWRCDIRDETAAASGGGGLLAGKSVALKDNISLASVPMMNGSKLLEGFVPCEDATVATRILRAGGRILGKATCEDLCFRWAHECVRFPSWA